jgi:hypothetical protein
MIFSLYIDPGSGSLFLQALIAGAISFLMFFKNIKLVLINFLNKIKSKFSSK